MSSSRSTDAFALSDDIVESLAVLRPVSATFQGIPGHDHAWDDYSPSVAARLVTTLQDLRRRVDELPPSPDAWQRLAARVMEDFLELELDWYRSGDHLADLNNLASTFQDLRRVFDVMNTSTREGWENVIRRLETIDVPARGYRTTLEEGRRSGQVVARRQVLACIDQGRVNAGDRSYFLTLPPALARAGVGDTALAARLEAAVAHARAAFGELVDYLEGTYLPSARERDAVGRERYLRQSRRFLGMDIDPLETYEWGWSQVRTIEEEMRRLGRDILPGADLPAVFELLKTDPARSAASREEFVRIMLERQQRALRELDPHFDIPDPIRQVEVKIAPPGGALGAYYIQPSEDFSRPGTVWYSLGDNARIPLYDEVSTAYHEGFPGHHLQCGIQVFLADRLSRAHRLLVWYSGYGEGWALYAEQLMHELGYFEKPEYVLGMYASQMMRACRVVVDIGAHLELAIPRDESFRPGETWDYARGVEMLTTRAFQPPDFTASEVTRYLGWPGQAISYKVGQRVILELRDELRRRQGDRFDLKDFHARVLNSGPVGLQLLRELVTDETRTTTAS